MRRGAPLSARRSAAAIAVRSRMLFGTSSSTRPSRSALAARSLLPVRIMSSAARAPIEPGQPLAAAGAGDQAELHLGETELGLGMVGGDAVGAGERELEAAAETGAVDRGDDRLGQGLDPAHHLLPLEAQPLRFGLGGERGELLDVGAGDEGVGLARDQHHRADLGVVAEPDEQRLELDLDRGVELVDRLAGQVEGDDRDPVAHLGGEGRHR